MMSAGRGAVLVAAAVVVGVLMLGIIGDTDSPGADTETPVPTTSLTLTPSTTAAGTTATTATTVAGTTATTKKSKTTSTTKASTGGSVRPAAQVAVQVLNGSGVAGAAGQRTADLQAKGYQMLPAGNAPSQRTGSGVQCVSGYDKEAAALVAVLKELAVTATVEALPNPVPSGFDTKANCYVLLGK
jgi:hypothetical protein